MICKLGKGVWTVRQAVRKAKDQYCGFLQSFGIGWRQSTTMGSPDHVCYRKHKVINDMDAEEEIEDISESVEELREKLAHAKKMMQEQSGYTLGDIAAKNEKRKTDVIDGNFLSLIFSVVLIVVVGVSVYAFYNLYVAVLRKFPSRHTEL